MQFPPRDNGIAALQGDIFRLGHGGCCHRLVEGRFHASVVTLIVPADVAGEAALPGLIEPVGPTEPRRPDPKVWKATASETSKVGRTVFLAPTAA
jgi:hypothetical protein